MRPIDIDKVLEDQKTIEGRKRALIDELLKEKAAAMKKFDDDKAAAAREFDEKLRKLGYVDGAKPAKRSHHTKKTAASAAKPATDKPKSKNIGRS